MKRNEFKLLMEDWKRNFVTEDEVVSNTLNEGYTELDRMILEEGLSDLFNKKVLKDLGLTLGMVAALSPIAQKFLLAGHSQMENNPEIEMTYDSQDLHTVKNEDINKGVLKKIEKDQDFETFKDWADGKAKEIFNEKVTKDSKDKFSKANDAWKDWKSKEGKDIINKLGKKGETDSFAKSQGSNSNKEVVDIMINYFMQKLKSSGIFG